MTINQQKLVTFPSEFKSQLPLSHQANAPYGDYVNAKGSDKSSYFHFERETSGGFGEYQTEKPIWNVKHTVDGFNYEVVGCVTAFDGDEVRCTFRLPEQFNPFGEDENVQEFTASGSHPFEAFENAVGQFVVFSINADRGGVL